MSASRIAVILSASVGSGACIVDEIPACPGQCFEYTVEYEIPTKCQTAGLEDIAIPFTGTNPDGYRGRYCFNSSTVPDVMAAIDHLEGGGQLSDLGEAVQSAYIATVNAVKDDLQAQCITAAAGQCTDEAQVCTGIAANMYEQLVVDETCVLALGGVEPVPVGPGEACEFSPVVQGTGSGESGDPCTETTTADTSTDGADETTGDPTGGMMFGPFGDIEALVRCDQPRRCEVDVSKIREGLRVKLRCEGSPDRALKVEASRSLAPGKRTRIAEVTRPGGAKSQVFVTLQ